MNAEAAAVAHIVDMLGGDPLLRRLVHGIYDREVPRMSPPYVVIREVVAADWGTKDRAGSELRVELRHVAASGPDGGLVAARISEVMPLLRSKAAGWEIASARLLRTRSSYDRQGQWSQSFDIRLRCLVA